MSRHICWRSTAAVQKTPWLPQTHGHLNSWRRCVCGLWMEPQKRRRIFWAPSFCFYLSSHFFFSPPPLPLLAVSLPFGWCHVKLKHNTCNEARGVAQRYKTGFILSWPWKILQKDNHSNCWQWNVFRKGFLNMCVFYAKVDIDFTILGLNTFRVWLNYYPGREGKGITGFDCVWPGHNVQMAKVMGS